MSVGSLEFCATRIATTLASVPVYQHPDQPRLLIALSGTDVQRSAPPARVSRRRGSGGARLPMAVFHSLVLAAVSSGPPMPKSCTAWSNG